MEKKVCFITGANSGIGRAAAIQLAEKGLIVLIGSRNKERGLQALKEIRQKSKSEDVHCVLIDLSSQSSIKTAVQEIERSYSKLDILIHNAADFDISRKQTVQSAEGIETVWATNHIGPVLLTNQLMGLLEKSEQARVITIASKGLLVFPNLKVDLEDPEFKNRKFSVSNAYYQSKLAQVMYTYWLANKLKDTAITANCIRVTNVKIDLAKYPNVSGFMKFMYNFKSKFALSPEKMAETYVYLAISPDVSETTGSYFNEKKKVVKSSKYSQDSKNIQDVMDLTEKYLGKEGTN